MSTKPNRSEFIDIKGLFTGYLRNWYWFVVSVVLCCCAAYVLSQKFPQKSRVNSSILVSQDDGAASMLNGLGGLFGADPYVQDEIFVITSHSVLKTVAQDLGINKIHRVKTGFLSSTLEYPKFPVDVYADPQIVDTLTQTLAFKIQVQKGGQKADIKVKAKGETLAKVSDAELPATISTDYGTFIVATTDSYSGDEDVTSWVTVTGYDSAGEELAEDLKSSIASKKSNVIELGIETTNPDYGCDILNNIMRVYNERGIEERNQRAMKTAAFIQERLDLITEALNSAESEIETYKQGQRIVDVATEATVNTKLKTEAELKYVELQTQQEILTLTLDFLSNPANKYELMPVASRDITMPESAIDTYNNLILKRMTMLNGAKPGNRNVADLEKQIDAMRENILVALERIINNNRVALKDVKSQVNLASSKLGHVPMQEREYINLKRQQEVKQQLYLFLLQRAEETAMLIANAIPKGQVIDQAYVMRDPVGPGKKVVFLIALIVGLILPIMVLYVKDLLRTRITGRSDVEKQTSLPILGEMCIDKSGHTLVVKEDTSSSASELFRMIRTNLQFVLGNPEDKVVMVTSSMSGEGKSFISTNLAAMLAMLGRKVVLIGMDIRKPQLANYLDVPPTPGLTEYLSNSQVSLETILRDFEPVPGLSLIVAGPIPPNPGELMTSPRIKELFDTLRKEYDYIILDTAPVGMVSDSFNLTQYVDATVFVVRNKVTRLQDLSFLNDIAEEGRLKRINIVVNGAESRKGYGYGYK